MPYRTTMDGYTQTLDEAKRLAGLIMQPEG
jgi:hypothetical protein